MKTNQNQQITKTMFEYDRIFLVFIKQGAALWLLAKNKAAWGLSIALTGLYGLFLQADIRFNVLAYIEKYAFSDWELLQYLGVLFVLDTFFGTWAAVKKHIAKQQDFSFEIWMDFIGKAFVYLGVLSVGHVIEFITMGGKVIGYSWLSRILYTMIMLYEARSVFKNMGVVYPAVDWVQSVEKKLGELMDREIKKEA